ncbi:MAG TPA: tetratricopeptide repeat protein [Candidatus Wunengus sp. YC60]|uniref:tetratricopeptide repeat protein n=1 Tax=Candidatus Wunengus sp. YC60 TaxID=3367697 RepID=UPI00402511F0
MDVIKLIRNKWFLAAFSVFYFGIVWIFFQIFYRKELLLQKVYKSSNTPDISQVMTLYNKMMRPAPDRSEFDSFYRLAKTLTRIEKKKELIKVLNKLIKTAPEDRDLRLWLAVELHNQGRYREAEKHFVILLKGKGEK